MGFECTGILNRSAIEAFLAGGNAMKGAVIRQPPRQPGLRAIVSGPSWAFGSRCKALMTVVVRASASRSCGCFIVMQLNPSCISFIALK
jgi:hypothetical protein